MPRLNIYYEVNQRLNVFKSRLIYFFFLGFACQIGSLDNFWLADSWRESVRRNGMKPFMTNEFSTVSFLLTVINPLSAIVPPIAHENRTFIVLDLEEGI